MNLKNKRASFLATLVGALLIASQAQAANMLVNPGFDADDASSGDVFGSAGWADFGGGTFTTSAAGPGSSPAANSPANSFKVFGNSGALQSFAATAGQTYIGSALGLNYSGDPLLNVSSLRIQIVYRDANGAYAGTAAGGNFAPGFNVFDSNLIEADATEDVWLGMGVGTAPAPDNTASVEFIVLGLANSGGAGFFDDASFELAPVPVPAAAWLFGSAMLGLMGVARRRKA